MSHTFLNVLPFINHLGEATRRTVSLTLEMPTLLQMIFLSRFGLIFFSWSVVKLPFLDWCAWVKRHLESERKLVGSEFLNVPGPILATCKVLGLASVEDRRQPGLCTSSREQVDLFRRHRGF